MATHRHLDLAGLEDLVLAVFQQAVAREAAGVELVGRVAAFLDRARHDPGLRFDAEGGASA